MQFPEPFGFIFTWFAALPLILFSAQSVTNAIVKDFLILKVLLVFIAPSIILWCMHSGGEKTDGFSECRGRVQTVVLKTFPSSGRYCRSLAAVQQTLSSVQSMSFWLSWLIDYNYELLLCLFLATVYIAAMFSIFSSCKTVMVYDTKSRLITLPESWRA